MKAHAKLTKKKKIVISIIAVILAIVITLVTVWMVPAKGDVSTDYWHSKMEYTNDYAITIEKDPNKDFKILAISDVQFNDALDFFGLVGTAYDTMDNLVEKEKPDLIVVMGDSVWAKFTKVSVLQFVKYMDSLGIPWAPINGNHDGEGVVDFNWVADQFAKSKTCLFKKGPNNIGGVGNFVINIMENGKIYKSLIMMDSHASRYYEDIKENKYDFIYDGQMDWYRWLINGMTEFNGGEKVDSMLFIHIPLNEYADAYKYWESTGFDPAIGFGEKNEEPGAGYVNSGMFDVIKELDSTKYVFAAHDHVNNYSVDYQGVRLTYTLKTGDRCYAKEGLNGGTRIVLGDDVKIEHIYV